MHGFTLNAAVHGFGMNHGVTHRVYGARSDAQRMTSSGSVIAAFQMGIRVATA